MAVDVDALTPNALGGNDSRDTDRGVDGQRTGTVAPNSTRSRSDSRLGLAVSLAAVLALASLVGWLGWLAHQSHSEDELRQAYLQAARQAVLNLTTIDHSKADADVQRILNGSTGAFHEDFQQNSQPFIDAVKHAQSRSEGTITAAGLESVGEGEAQALVAVTVKTSLPGAGESPPRAWRMRITMQDVDHEMKVSNVSFVP